MTELQRLTWVQQLKAKKEQESRTAEELKRLEEEKEASLSNAFRPFFTAMRSAVGRDVEELATVFPEEPFRFQMEQGGAETFTIERPRPWPVSVRLLAGFNPPFLQLTFSKKEPIDRCSTVRIMGARISLESGGFATAFNGISHSTPDSFAESVLKYLLKQAGLCSL